jgi:hypothetical protein
MRERAETPLEDPQAQLERALIDEFLQKHGCSLATVDRKPPAERANLLRQASLYAVTRLAEIDARAAYVHELHGGGPR